MSKNLRVGVGLVAYEISDIYIERLNSSLSGMDYCYKVVVDNSPNDKKRQLFESNDWLYIHSPDNPGFGRSHNHIFNLFGNKSDYHLILNPDIEFTSNILIILEQWMDNNLDAGAVAPAVYYPDGVFQELRKLLPSPYGWFLRRFAKGTRLLLDYNYNFELKMAPKNVVFKYPYMSGCFMFLRSNVIREIGLFDENIFMYCEDTDLSRRLWINNTPAYYNGGISIVHDFNKGSHKSLRLLFIAIKSTFYYFNKWGWFDSERNRINEECIRQFYVDKKYF